jgi:hypothetical protein
VVGSVHDGAIMSLQRAFLFSPLKYNIDNLFL